MSEPGSRRVIYAVRIGLVVFAVALSLAASEAALRLFGCQQLRGQSYQSAPFLAENRYWGVWHYPNQVMDHREACFHARYRTNSLGMKGPEVRPGTAKIALLGDSFVEGFGNDNDATVDQVMQRQLGDRYDVLNFGVSGGFTTVDELALYENFARHFDPRVVVLFFVNYNDLQENLQSDQERLVDHAAMLRPPASFEDAVLEIRRQLPGDLEKPLPKGSCLRHLYRIAERAVRLRMQGILHFRWDFRSELERVYLPRRIPASHAPGRSSKPRFVGCRSS